MPLFFADALNDDKIVLGAEESRHCLKVLRKRPGDLIDLTDGKGTHVVARIVSAGKQHCALEIVKKNSIEPDPFYVHVAMAPVKNHDRIEWFVEKATEIGVHGISFIISAFTERKTVNLNRLNKKAVSALKQSGRHHLPDIHDAMPLTEWLEGYQADEMFAAHPEGRHTGLLSRVATPGKRYLLLIGPEGGFSEAELTLARDKGYRFVTLGKNILRAETAGIVGCQMLCEINF